MTVFPISAGDSHTLAIRSGGSLFGWGDNTYRQVGDTVNFAKSWTQIALGNSYVVGLRSDGLLFTWGNNTSGQLGNNSTTATSSPVQVGSESWSYLFSCTDGPTTLAIR